MRFMCGERGQRLVLIVSLLPFMIAFLALVTDVGNVFLHQRMVQNAADAAASAAGLVLYTQGRTVAISTATYYATQNGYADNGDTVLVMVDQPPTSGAYAGNSKYIQVVVQERITPIFASVIWNGSFTIRGRAIACYPSQAVGIGLNGLTPILIN